MGSEYMGPLFDPKTQQQQPSPDGTHSVAPGTEYTQPIINNNQSPNDETQPMPVVHRVVAPVPHAEPFREPAYREHVTGSLVVPPSEAPYFRPTYQPYQQPAQPQQGQQRPQGPGYPPVAPPQYPAYQGYPGQYGYNGYAHANHYPPYPGYSDILDTGTLIPRHRNQSVMVTCLACLSLLLWGPS